LDPYPRNEDIERLYIAAHALAGTSASYGFPLFSVIAGKLAHIFQYAMNTGIPADAAAPLVEFVGEAVALLESDLIMISANMMEAEDDITAFRQRFPFAFQSVVSLAETETSQASTQANVSAAAAETEFSFPVAARAEAVPEVLPQDDEVSSEVLGFFVPEAEEHLQVVTHCLLS